MITADASDYLGNVIFCDDIRNEIGGKLSYMGIYKGFMGIHSGFPVTLPKFCFAVSFWQHKKVGKVPLRLWIFLPGDPDDKPTIEGEYPLDSSTNIPTPEPAKSALPPAEYDRTEIVVAFSPFVIAQPGLIKVRIVREDVMHRLGILSVFQLTSEENQRGPVSRSTPE